MRPLCVRYETDIRMNSRSSNSVHQIEVMLEGVSITFELDGLKEYGLAVVLCKSLAMAQFSDPPQIKHVRIKTLTGSKMWGIKSLHIQSNPSSEEYEVYSLNENEPKFWMAGDVNSCAINNDGYQCCENGEECDLKPVTGNVTIVLKLESIKQKFFQ